MPVYLYWGEDDYRLAQAVKVLHDRVLDPNWASFNYDKIAAEQPDAVVQGLNQAMTPAFGTGSRLVWLTNTTLCHHCSEDLLIELQRTLASLPKTSHLLLTTQTKPDGRSKSTKLLQQYAEIREFSTIAPWKTGQLVQEVKQAARQVGVRLTPDAIELLAQSIGNDTRQLYCELEKLQLFALGTLDSTPDNSPRPLDAKSVTSLVAVTTQNSLQLADAIRRGSTAQALALVADLISHNEPALRIVATLVRQFRTWLWVKLMMEAGERDERAIAQAAQVSNPKRIYFLQQEVQQLSANQLLKALPLLLELEVDLKRGADAIVAGRSATAILQSKVVELCQLYC